MIRYLAVVVATREQEAAVQALTGLMLHRTLRQTEAVAVVVVMLMLVVLMAEAEELEEAMALAAEVEEEAVMPLLEEVEALPAV